MLQLIRVNKSYNKEHILKNISLNLNKNEVVMITGPSGSGKTTLLNMIFNLDSIDSGEILYKGKNIKNININHYHNQIGYILQNFELLNDLNVQDNISLPLEITGGKNSKKIDDLVNAIGLNNKMKKNVSLLSGGEKQRVAIARSIVNNPDMIIADEPTGSLDSKNEQEIIELLLNVSKNKLLIIVTHNIKLAKKYGTRIIELKDGVIINDTNPQEKKLETYKEINNKMKSSTIFKLARKNISKKKLRFILTLIATTIGLISVSLVINISNSLNNQINNYKNTYLKSFPIIINQDNGLLENNEEYLFPKYKGIKVKKTNNSLLDKEKVNYINNIDTSLLSGISNRYHDNIYLLAKNDNISFIEQKDIIELPKSLNNYFSSNFDLIKGSFPQEKNEAIIIIDGNNQVSKSLFSFLDNNQSIKLLSNNELFIKHDYDYYINNNLNDMYKNGIDIKVVGIMRGKKYNQTYQSVSGLGISEEILFDLSLINLQSEIVKSQINSKRNVLTKELVKDYNLALKELNYNSIPLEITIFPKDYESRQKIINYLDENKVIYTDYAMVLIDLTTDLIKSITLVLGLFSFISLIVIIIMIGIITYINILENKKEIGILRLLGMKKKDLINLFNLENVLIAYLGSLLSFLISNYILKVVYVNIFKQNNVYNIEINNFLFLLIISLVVCQLGGFIPLIKLSRQKIVKNLK